MAHEDEVLIEALGGCGFGLERITEHEIKIIEDRPHYVFELLFPDGQSMHYHEWGPSYARECRTDVPILLDYVLPAIKKEKRMLKKEAGFNPVKRFTAGRRAEEIINNQLENLLNLYSIKHEIKCELGIGYHHFFVPADNPKAAFERLDDFMRRLRNYFRTNYSFELNVLIKPHTHERTPEQMKIRYG